MIGSESLRQARAILHIQWLSTKNSLRSRSERLGLVASILVAVIWYGFWSAGAVGLFTVAMWTPAAKVKDAIAGILFFVFLYWQISPLLTASMGISIDLRKMALFPIGVRTLFLVECLLRLVTGLEMILLLTGLSVGMMVRAPERAPLLLPAVLLFIAFNVLLSAGLRNLLERVLQRRRVREVFLFIVVMASALPQLILWSGWGDAVGRRLYRVFRFLPRRLLPTTLVARTFSGDSAAADWLVMAAWCVAGAVFGYVQFRRSFRFDFAGARAQAVRATTDRETWADRLYRIPARLLPDPMAALVEKEIRYLARSPRFRFLFLMGCSFGVVAWLPFGMGRSGPSSGFLQSSFLTLLSLYGLLLIGQATFLNSFGFDRSAARYFFWLPISPVDLLLAKNLAGAAVLLLQVAVLAGICVLLRIRLGPWQLLEAMGVALISALYVSSAGNLTSVMFASGLSPERVSRGAAGRGIQGLIVFFYPILLIPVLAAYFARYYWESLRGFILLLAIAAFGGLALYVSTLPLAARLGYQRRERLLEELSRGEGPLVAE